MGMGIFVVVVVVVVVCLFVCLFLSRDIYHNTEYKDFTFSRRTRIVND